MNAPEFDHLLEPIPGLSTMVFQRLHGYPEVLICNPVSLIGSTHQPNISIHICDEFKGRRSRSNRLNSIIYFCPYRRISNVLYCYRHP